MLNPTLYAGLRKRFGLVRISQPGVPLKWVIEVKEGRQQLKQLQGGEQYMVNCPFCGDTRGRLCIGHSWLTTPARGLPQRTRNAKCYNEDCQQIYEYEFYRHFLNPDAEIAAILAKPIEPPPPIEIRLPKGLVPLDQLPPDHAAVKFIAEKYPGLNAAYLTQFYGVSLATVEDEDHRLACGRIIFPIYENGKLMGWQGRWPGKHSRKWLLPGGFRKTIYGFDIVPPNRVPLIAEGITSAICCGPTGVAIFGKTLETRRAQQVANRWATAVVVTDPETFVPDHREGGNGRVYAQEMLDELNKHCQVPAVGIRWPEPVLDLARRKIDQDIRKKAAKKAGAAWTEEEVRVPDPADIGLRAMRELIDQLPASHRTVR